MALLQEIQRINEERVGKAKSRMAANHIRIEVQVLGMCLGL